jgi:hypothetical protein
MSPWRSQSPVYWQGRAEYWSFRPRQTTGVGFCNATLPGVTAGSQEEAQRLACKKLHRKRRTGIISLQRLPTDKTLSYFFLRVKIILIKSSRLLSLRYVSSYLITRRSYRSKVVVYILSLRIFISYTYTYSSDHDRIEEDYSKPYI